MLHLFEFRADVFTFFSLHYRENIQGSHLCTFATDDFIVFCYLSRHLNYYFLLELVGSFCSQAGCKTK